MNNKSRRISGITSALLMIPAALVLCTWGFGGEDLFFTASASLVLTAAALPLLRRQGQGVTWRPWMLPAMLLLLLGVGSLFSSVNSYRTVLALTYWYVLILTYLLVSSMSFDQRVRLLMITAVVVAAYAVYGFFQLAGLFDNSFWYNRAFASRFGNSNHLATYLAAGLSISISLLFLARSRFTRSLAGLCIPIIGVALVYTQTRAVWLIGGVVFAGLIFSIARQAAKRKLVSTRYASVMTILLILCCVGGLFAFHEPIRERIQDMSADKWSSVNHRLNMWSSTTEMIKAHPLGVGQGAFGYAYLKYKTSFDRFHAFRAHNEPLQIVAELGWVALPILVWFLATLFVTLCRSRSRSEERDARTSVLYACAGSIVLIYCLHSLVDFPLRLRANLLLFVVALACASPLRMVSEKPKPAGRGAHALRVMLHVAVTAWWICILGSQWMWKDAERHIDVAEFRQAEEHLQRAAKWMPLNPRVQFELGRANYALAPFGSSKVRASRVKGAIEAFDRSLAIAPLWPDTHLRLARTHQVAGDFEQAEQHYLAAIECDPSLAVYRMHYANFLLDRGRYEEAVSRYRDAFAHFADEDPQVSWRKTIARIYRVTRDPDLIRRAIPYSEHHNRTIDEFLRKKGHAE